MTEIIVRYEEKVIERIITEKRRISIGRTSENDIVLDNRGVSRNHALIEIHPENAIIIDNESLNGTFLNNRRVEEEIFCADDVITIGKYTLTLCEQSQSETKFSDLDGTMILNTRKQRDRIDMDKRDRDIVSRAGGASVLIGEEHTDIEDIQLGAATLTFGKASYCNIRVRGWFVSDIQAKISTHNDRYVLNNVGHRNKTRVNGEPVDEVILRNADLVQIGRSVFRFVSGAVS